MSTLVHGFGPVMHRVQHSVEEHLKNGGRRSWRAVVLLAFMATVASFVGSSLYTDQRVEEIRESSESLSGNALPSVVNLANIQAEVGAIQREARDVAAQRATVAGELTGPLNALDTSRAAYAATPYYPGEEPLWREADVALVRLRENVNHIRERLDVGDSDGAMRVYETELEPTADTALYQLNQLIRLNAIGGELAARDVDAARTHAARAALILNGLSVVAALVALVVAARSVQKHSALVEARARELEQFAARVAHDIRGPLMPLALALDKISKTSAPLETEKYAAVGLRGVKRVQQIVTDLLAFAQSGATPDRNASARIREVVEGIVAEIEPLAHEKGISVRVEAGDADEAVACAPGILMSILSNLVRNAVKYMGASRERIITLRAEDVADHIRIIVEDTGPGFPKAMAKQIFEPYVRASSSELGLGIGLATVKRFTEAHGGTAGARPRDGGGSVFWVELPVSRS